MTRRVSSRRSRLDVHTAAICSLVVFALAATAGPARRGTEAGRYLSPESIVADPARKLLYVAAATADEIIVYDTTRQIVRRKIAVPDGPSGLALSSDGSRLFVTGGVAAGKVHAIDTRTGVVLGALAAGHSPTAPALSRDGRTLYVANRFNHDISVLDIVRKTQVARIPVLREPVASRLSSDGSRLFVANQLPDGPAAADHVAAAVSVLDTRDNRVLAHVRLADGATGLRDLTVSPDGRYVYVTHVLARYKLPASQIERGWIQTNAISILDAARLELVNTVLLDDITEGAAVPWGIGVTADGRHLCVSHSGTHEISVIDRDRMHLKLELAAAGRPVNEVSQSAADLVNDMTFLTGIRTRVPLLGNGPRAIAIAGSKVYAAEYFTDSLGELDLAAAPLKARSVNLGEAVPLTPERRGEMLFHDAQYAYQKWLSCTSCHPSDGRPDALNWDLMLDNVGNGKNTKSLLLAHRTPPTTITGTRANAETSVRAGFRFIQFAARPEEHALAVDAYLKSLRPVPSPYLINGKLSAAAERGKQVFQNTGCPLCHSGELYTDMRMYSVGTGRRQEKGIKFDTPTLIEVWRTAPYLHDGRAATLKDVFAAPDSGRAHSLESKRTDKEIEDLIAFVLSL